MKIYESRAVTLILLLIFSLVSGFNVIDIHAQTPLSKIVGTVKDQTGGVVVAAKVTVTDEGRGYQRSAISDQDGNYILELLLQGTYSLSCELQGFKTYTRTQIPLQSRQVLRIDAALEVGEVTDSVTVSEAAPVVASETGEIQASTGTRQLLDKIQGHPTTGYFSAGQFITYGGYSSVLTSYRGPGTTSNQTRFRMDGLETDIFQPPTPPDAIQEVKISYSGLRSESQSPVIADVITRSGNNQFHGLAELNAQNPGLNSLGPTPGAVRSGQKTNKIWYFRGSGPLYVPGLYDGRKKTFFWADMQRSDREDIGQNRGAYFIAPPAWRNGDFSRAPATSFTNTSKTLINPYTGQPFTGGIIPDSLINPTARKIQGANPQPNLGDTGDPHFSGLNWRYVPGGDLLAKQYTRTYNLRFDHQLTTKDTLGYMFGRTTSPWYGDQNEGFHSWLEKQVPVTTNHTVVWTRTFSARLLNEFRAGIARSSNSFGPLPADESPLGYKHTFDAGGLAALRDLGFSYQPTDSSQFTNALPAVCISGVFAPLCDWTGTGNRLGASQGFLENRHVTNNLSIHHGVHAFKTGIDYLRSMDAGNSGNPFGNFLFDGRFTGLPYTDYLLGLPGTSTRRGILPRPYRLAGWSAGYFQDDWKVRPNLTLELGLRFERFPVAKEKNLMMVNFDPKTGSFVVPNDRSLSLISPAFPKTQFPVLTAAQAGYPELLRSYPQPLFYPRIGIAWRPFSDAKTVVRAGFGQFSSAPGTTQSLVSNSPYALNETFANVLTNGQAAFSFPDPYPTATGTVPGQTAFGVIPEFPVPYSHNWNLTVEREILPNTSLRLSYLGAKVTQLAYRRDINKPQPGPLPYRSDCGSQPAGSCVGPLYSKFNSSTLVDAGANQNAHIMQIELHRRWAAGLEFTVDYAWNKTITDAQETGSYRGGADYGPFIENPYDRQRERAIHGRTVPHRVVVHHVWSLPFGQGQRWLNHHRAMDALAGGWTLVGTWAYSSRIWVTPLWSGSDFSNTGTFSARPDLLPGCDPTVDDPSPDKVFNAGCFVQPPNGRFGNSGKSVFRGVPFGTNMWQDSYFVVSKEFKLSHKMSEQGIRFRLSAYINNLINRPYLAAAFPSGYSDANNVTVNSPNSSKGFYTGQRTVALVARMEF